jgi:O-antigen ligase
MTGGPRGHPPAALAAAVTQERPPVTANNPWLSRVSYATEPGRDHGLRRRLFADVQWTVPLVAYLAFIFAITSSRWPIGNIAIAAGLVGLAMNRRQLRIPNFLIWFAIFIGWSAIGYIRTPYPEPVWDRLVELVKVWAIVLVGVNALRSRPQIRLFTVFFLACFAFYPVRGALLNYFFYRETVAGRAVWVKIFSNPNDLAALLLLPLSMTAGILVTDRARWVKRAAQVGLAVIPMVILMTQSRGGVIALAVFIAFSIAGQWRQLRALLGARNRRRVIVAIVLVLVGVSIAAPNGVWERIAGLKHATTTADLREVDREGSARQRYEIARVAVKIIKENAVTGVGVGAYPFAHTRYARDEEFDPMAAGMRDTHDTYLNVLAESGIPGFIVFLGMVLSVGLSAERVRRRCRRESPRLAMPLDFLEIALFAFFIAGLFGSFASVTYLYIHLGFLWSCSVITERELERAHPSVPKAVVSRVTSRRVHRHAPAPNY